jgi:transcriptional regulator with XRE-family HTH domain
VGFYKEKNSLIRFGERIKKMRELLNLSQEQIHYATGISQPYIVKIEKAETNIGLGYISLLASFYGLEDFELLQYDNALPDADKIKQNILRFLKQNDIEAAIFFKKGLIRYLELTLLTTNFFNTPKFTKEIAEYLQQKYKTNFTTSAISQAMESVRKKGLVEKLSTDRKSKFQYRKLIVK